MKKTRFISILFIIVTLISYSQQNNALKSSDLEGVFKGKIKDKYEIEMFLRLNEKNNTINGSYYYVNKMEPIKLDGKIEKNSKIILKEFVLEQQTGLFEGQFQNGVYSGFWSTPDGKKKMPFNVILTKNIAGTGKWAGNWTRLGSTKWDIAEIEITNVTSKNFTFHLSAQSGSHTGDMSGVAVINGNKAFYKDKEEQKCELNFILNGDEIELTQTAECQYWAGVGVHFAGEYTSKPVDLGIDQIEVFETKEIDFAFKKFLGEENYKKFSDICHLVNEEDDKKELGAKAFSWAVRGMYTIMEAIVLWTPDMKFYAAVIDEDLVRYFSNDPKYINKLPKAIEAWRERFAEKKVVYMNVK